MKRRTFTTQTTQFGLAIFLSPIVSPLFKSTEVEELPAAVEQHIQAFIREMNEAGGTPDKLEGFREYARPVKILRLENTPEGYHLEYINPCKHTIVLSKQQQIRTTKIKHSGELFA